MASLRAKHIIPTAFAICSLLLLLASIASLATIGFLATVGPAATFVSYAEFFLNFSTELTLNITISAACSRIAFVIASHWLRAGIIWPSAAITSRVTGRLRSIEIRRLWRIWRKYGLLIQFFIFLLIFKYIYLPGFIDVFYLGIAMIFGGFIGGAAYFSARGRHHLVPGLRVAALSAKIDRNRVNSMRASLIAIAITGSYFSLTSGNFKALERMLFSPEIRIEPMGMEASIVARDAVGVLLYSKSDSDHADSRCVGQWCFIPWGSIESIGASD